MDRDISQFVLVQFQSIVGKPYVESVPAETVASFMRGLFPTGRYGGTTFSLTNQVLTIPAGQVFILEDAGGAYKITTKEDLILDDLVHGDKVYIELGSSTTGIGVLLHTREGPFSVLLCMVVFTPSPLVVMNPGLDNVLMTKKAYTTLLVEKNAAIKTFYSTCQVTGTI